jgi:UDP-N-acetylglucosamine diphosphorylase/glucosamine-1-phosphate N-acetyltransferase
MNKKVAVIILAAGKGTRMNSSLAKVLHPLCGAPLLSYPVSIARGLHSDRTVVVLGYQADLVRDVINDEGLTFVLQEPQLGTGHAVMQAYERFRDFSGTVLILCGDVPLLAASTAAMLIEKHISGTAAVTVLTTFLEWPAGYGRISRLEGDMIARIIEDRDATDEEKKIKEINTGIYCVDSAFLFAALHEIRPENAQKEYYLTDIVEIAVRRGLHAQAFPVYDSREVMGINTQEELDRAEDIMKERTKH